ELKIAQRALNFFGSGIARPQQTLDKIDKVPLHERFFQKMDRSEAGDLFALLGQMDAGQHDRARIGMTRPEIVKKVLSKLVRRVHVEDEKFRLHTEQELLRFLEAMRHFDPRIGSRLLQ